MTIDELIKHYLDLKDYKTELERAHKETLAVYDQGMQAILDELKSRMTMEDVGFKGKHGTVYKSTTMLARVSDRTAFLEFVFSTNNSDFLTSAVSKEAVREYLEEHAHAPPGIKVDHMEQIRIRRS